MRRIAFVCPRFSEGPTVGGAETLLKNLAVRTARRGHEVAFLTTCARDHFTWKNEMPPGTRDFEGMRVHFFPVDEDRDVETFLRAQEIISRGGMATENDEKAWLSNSVNSRRLYDHLRRHGGGYDRIVIGPYLFGLTYFAAGILPDRTVLVPCLHDEPFAYLKSIGEMFRNAAVVMFNSEPERDLANRLYGLESRKCFVVGMGLDAFESDPRAFALKRGLTGPYAIYSGRREPLKGTPLLLDYMNTFLARTGRDIKLVFTGSGRLDIPDKLAPRVLDVGMVCEEEKRNAMAGAVAFCHPSANESFGIVILESWLAGTPVLVNAHSNVMVFHCARSNGGLWFRSYPEFEEELLLLLDNAPLRSALAQSGRKYVLEQYSWEKIEKKLFDALA